MNIINKINSLKPWYQKINLDGILTTKNNISGEGFWRQIKYYLPDDLIDKRVLDLGSNAGFYSVQCANLGAEVVGIEVSKLFYKQSLFIKEFFEKKLNKKLNITFINSDLGDVDFYKLGKFDYVLAIAVLYHIGKHKYGKYTKEAMKEQEEVIKALTSISKNIIVRTRNKRLNNITHYNEVFGKFGFKPFEVKTFSGNRKFLLVYRG